MCKQDGRYFKLFFKRKAGGKTAGIQGDNTIDYRSCVGIDGFIVSTQYFDFHGLDPMPPAEKV
jgi:hypothetical protein